MIDIKLHFIVCWLAYQEIYLCVCVCISSYLGEGWFNQVRNQSITNYIKYIVQPKSQQILKALL